MKQILPEQYKDNAQLFSAQPVRSLDWDSSFSQRESAAQRPDTEIFPLSHQGEERLSLLKKHRPKFFASMREENLWRLFAHYQERFEIFEADCRNFEKYWYAMDAGRELWAWADSVEGAHSVLRVKDYEHLASLIVYPLREVRQTAKLMQEKMTMYFEAQTALCRFGKTLATLEDDHRRKYAKQ